MTNKKKYIVYTIIGYAVLILPVLIYNIVNYDIFTNISSIKLTFTFLIAMAMIGIAILTKMKNKAGIFILLIGLMLTIIAEASSQIGYSLIMISSGMILDSFIFKPLALKYKEAWYGEQGKQITYTREL